MYISEAKLRNIIRKELIEESFWDDVVNATPIGMIGKAAHDLYYDTLGGEIEVGRLPWESNSTDIQKMKWGSSLLLGSDEKSAVPVILVGKRKPLEHFILKAGKAKPKDMTPLRDSTDNKGYVKTAIKILDPEASEKTISKTLEALKNGQLYYAADTSTLYAPLSDDEKAGVTSFMRDSGIEAGASISGIAAGAFTAAGLLPLAAAIEAVGNGFNILDVFNKLDKKDFIGAGFGALGLIPGGDTINILKKLGNLEDTFPAPLADDLGKAIIDLLDGDMKNTITDMINSYIEDRDLDPKAANPFIQQLLKSIREIGEGFLKIAKKGDTKIEKKKA